jgi:hypothetical protein
MKSSSFSTPWVLSKLQYEVVIVLSAPATEATAEKYIAV